MAKTSLAATSQTSSCIMSFSITLVEAVHCQTQSQGVERSLYLTLKRKHGISVGRDGEGGKRAFGEQPSDMLRDCPHLPPSRTLSPCSHSALLSPKPLPYFTSLQPAPDSSWPPKLLATHATTVRQLPFLSWSCHFPVHHAESHQLSP